jgi:hypothetical protein
MRPPDCLCVSVCASTPNNFWIPEPICVKLGMYIMAHKHNSTAYFINSSISNTNITGSHIF